MKNIEDINRESVKKILAKKKLPEFFAGDTIKVGVRIVEGKRAIETEPLSGNIFERSRPSRGRPSHGGPTLDPLLGLDNPRMPLRSKLLSVPAYRTDYLRYLRTIAEVSMARENLAPVIDHYRNLMIDEVKIDTKKLLSYDDFVKG